MMQRCRSKQPKAFKKYGGRGITVCERWHFYPNFLADMGACPGPLMTVDRIDNARGYEPGNCRWATKAEQSRNRPNHCVALTHGGQTLIATEWARKLGMSPNTIFARIRLGWTAERILTTPPNGGPVPNRHPKLRQLTLNGQTKPLMDWAQELGLSANALRMRLRLGWTVKRALTTR